MQISSVLSGFSETALGQRGEAAELGDRAGSDSAGRIVASFAGRSDALGNILSQYDVADISPRQFSEMLQKLFDSGVISDKEFRQLAAVRQDLDAAGIKPDDAVNLLEFYSEKIEELQPEADAAEANPSGADPLGPLLGRFEWIQKFAAIQLAPDSIGLDALV